MTVQIQKPDPPRHQVVVDTSDVLAEDSETGEVMMMDESDFQDGEEAVIVEEEYTDDTSSQAEELETGIVIIVPFSRSCWFIPIQSECLQSTFL